MAQHGNASWKVRARIFDTGFVKQAPISGQNRAWSPARWPPRASSHRPQRLLPQLPVRTVGRSPKGVVRRCLDPGQLETRAGAICPRTAGGRPAGFPGPRLPRRRSPGASATMRQCLLSTKQRLTRTRLRPSMDARIPSTCVRISSTTRPSWRFWSVRGRPPSTSSLGDPSMLVCSRPYRAGLPPLSGEA